VIETRGARPRGAADRSGAPVAPQADRWAPALGVVLLGGWAALTCAAGGIDLGDGLAGRGATAAFVALLVAAPAAAWVVWSARDAPALRSGPTRLALAGAAGLAVWSACSIAWSLAPDLSWIEANRAALALAALALGVGLGALLPGAPARLGVGLTVAAAPAVVWALLVKIAPTVAGSDTDLARLQDPLGAWNGLALLAVIAVPGAMWVASRPAPPAWARPLAAAWLCALGVTILLTYSRSGLVALAIAVLVVLWLADGRGRAVLTLAAAAVGAILPALYGLTESALTTDELAASARRSAGLGLGWRLVLGMAIAAALALAVPALARRLPAPRPRRRRAWAGAAIVLVVAAAGVAAIAAGGEDSAVGNDPNRLTSLAGNNRGEWWAQAGRGWLAAPLEGDGAGTFRLIARREREDGNDALLALDPHQLELKLLSELGVVGMLLLGLTVAGVAWAASRAVRRGRDPALALPAAVALAFLVQAQLDWTWSIPALAVPAYAAGGVLLAAGGGPPGRARAPGWPAGAALAAAALVVAASALLPWWSAREVSAGQDALAAERPAAALDDARLARDLNPLALGPLALEAAAHAADQDPAGWLGALREGTRVQPDNPIPWSRLARALGSGPAADAAWRRVLALDPHNVEAREALGLPPG